MTTCPPKKFLVGRTEVEAKCAIEGGHRNGHCRAMLTDDVMISWPRRAVKK